MKKKYVSLQTNNQRNALNTWLPFNRKKAVYGFKYHSFFDIP